MTWLRGAAWRCGPCSDGAAPVTAAASFAARTMAAACGLCRDQTMPARRDHLWQEMSWHVCAQITSGRPCTSLVGGRRKKCIFWGSNIRIRKCSLKEILLHFGGFYVAGLQKAATPGTSAEAQIPGNCLPIVIRAIPLIRAHGAY